MATKKYTVVLVPDDGETSRSFGITKRRIRIALALLLLLLVGSIAFAVYALPRALGYNELKRRNQALMDDRMKVAGLIRELQQIDAMANHVRRFLVGDFEFSPDSALHDTSAALLTRDYAREYPISYLENIPSYPPVDGFVSQEFNYDPSNRGGGHPGLDIAARTGSAVHAAASGMVVFSDWTYQYGNLIIIFHGDDYFSLYGHNDRNLVQERELVQRGDLIALVGETGITTGPHLHFEIWKDGDPIDPGEFIVQYQGRSLSERKDG